MYNATKFSGRTKKNLGIGIFNAVTAPMFAEFKNSKGEYIKQQTEPLTNYSILVLDQALKNRSSLTFTNTNVTRAGNNNHANVMAVDVSLFDKKNLYNLQVQGRYSTIYGNSNSNGYKSYINFAKVSGKYQWGIFNNIESKNYNPNDLGLLFAANEFTTSAYFSFNQFTPNKHFNFRRYSFSVTQTNLYQPFQFQNLSYNSSFLHVFKNFWDISLEASGQPIWGFDYFDLRTQGRKLKKAPYHFVGLFGSSDSRKKMFLDMVLALPKVHYPMIHFI